MSKLAKLRPSVCSRSNKTGPSFRASAALAFTLAVGAITASMQAQAASNLKVETHEGRVKGVIVNGVAEFLGIPYGEPPVGRLRWMPPKEHAPWNGVLQAKAFGPTCAQITENGLYAGPANNNEDCLYLNVFTPNVDPAGNEKLPVIVWIHGGGNMDGESNDYDGGKLAAQGHTVVVTINYRLGLLGWFAHPALDAEGHLFGDYGLLDQQLALKWVKRNIAQFGGDKNNVTVGGQSAGSVDTAANVISPLAAGLFDRGIFQSKIVEPTPLPTAEAKGTAFAAAAGCGSGSDAATAKCLRSLTAQQIMALQGTTSASGPYGNFLVADGRILPSGLLTTAFKNGQFNHMPVMSGTTEDEGNFFIAVPEYFSGTPVTEASFDAYVARTFGGNAGPGGSPPAYPAGAVNKVLARYPLYAYTTPQLALDAVETDVIACTQRYYDELLADQTPVYAYEFDDRTAPFYFPKMTGFQSLAYHTSDIQYLFPLYHGGPDGIPHALNKKQEQLSDALVTAWTNFAWTGNPNGQGNSPWPRYKAKANRPSFLSENIPVLSTFTDAQFSSAHKCDLWDKLLTY
ncbi:carboxylesterase/lipase family protein [Methylocella tundrae]|uniref:Carboxylic ester hydrolase n=1 Tax=Methylocella tundrae TaxID=227605 RepID=A0A4V6IMI5_METTU|nr:carboxylesterase family protein [Methylocella tundrae]WPP06044.1 carboxylesterase family protein [Methylocella tundrae]VFU08630.1 Carboxylic ester hydrolase [Methylocella tundrae]